MCENRNQKRGRALAELRPLREERDGARRPHAWIDSLLSRSFVALQCVNDFAVTLNSAGGAK
jgi:hypothetical protein